MAPSTVRRVADANAVHLENAIPVNGSFRIYLFAGRREKTARALQDFVSNLLKDTSFYKVFERQDKASVSHHERHNPDSLFFTICTIFADTRGDIDIAALPSLLARYSMHIYADEIPDIRVLDAKAAAHAKDGTGSGAGRCGRSSSRRLRCMCSTSCRRFRNSQCFEPLLFDVFWIVSRRRGGSSTVMMHSKRPMYIAY